jgi:hypothetical protein
MNKKSRYYILEIKQAYIHFACKKRGKNKMNTAKYFFFLYRTQDSLLSVKTSLKMCCWKFIYRYYLSTQHL